MLLPIDLHENDVDDFYYARADGGSSRVGGYCELAKVHGYAPVLDGGILHSSSLDAAHGWQLSHRAHFISKIPCLDDLVSDEMCRKKGWKVGWDR